MTGSLRILARNVGDLATLSCVLPAIGSNMPVSNLQKPRRARVFRWSTSGGSPSGQTILGTWGGTGYYVSQCGLDRHNLTSSGYVRVRGYATSDWTGAATQDSGVLAPYNAVGLGSFTWGQSPLGVDIKDGYLGYQYFNCYLPRTLIKSFRIDLSDDSLSYNEVARLVLGDYSEFTRNVAWGVKFGWREKTTQEDMDGGSVISDGRIPRRFFTGRIPGLTPAERTIMSEIVRYSGLRKHLSISLQPGEGADLERDFTILQAKFTPNGVPDMDWEIPEAHMVPQIEVVEG